MKNFLLAVFVCTSFFSRSQTVISSVNSGASSTESMQFSVGEIFVLPANSNETNSGTMGILYRLQLLVTGVDNKLFSYDLRFFPNPLSHSLYLETNSGKQITQLLIYNLQGMLVASQPVRSGSADLTYLPDGAYIIRTDLQNIQPFKIIKQ